MNYFITGGTGFIGTHLTNLLKEVHPEANIYNLDIVEPGTPLPAVKGHYHSPLRKSETLKSTFIYCDVRKPIELNVPVSSEDVIFNFAAVHRTPGHPDHEYFETNIRGAENVCEFAEKSLPLRAILSIIPLRKPLPTGLRTMTENAWNNKPRFLFFDSKNNCYLCPC